MSTKLTPRSRQLIAESNYEMNESRDPFGAKIALTTTKRGSVVMYGEPKTETYSARTMGAGEYTKARRQSINMDLHGHTETVAKPHAVRRRTLPPTPAQHRPAHGDLEASAKCPMSSAQAVHRDPEEMMMEQDSKMGGPYSRTIQPLGPAAEWKGKDMKMAGLSNRERPPWASVTGEANHVFGENIAPALGAWNRHQQNEQQFHDRHFLQSLRVPDDPNVQWRIDQVRRKTSMYEDVDEDLPDVFSRLTDHTKYPGAHRARFSADGFGMGILGYRTDTTLEETIAGNAQITRNMEPEMDKPIMSAMDRDENRPRLLMEWDEDKLQPDAYYTHNIPSTWNVTDATEDPIMQPDQIYGRLAADKHATNVRDEGEYGATQRRRSSWNVDAHHVKAWQTHDLSETG